jgi:hypothetical protein
MGTWSIEPFGNDTACDWSYQFLESKDLSVVEAALDAVLDANAEHLEDDSATEAIAAVEILAKVLGRGTQTDSYTEDIDEWIQAHPQHPSGELLQKAKRALTRITAPGSELLGLWEEGGDATEWLTSVKQLEAAISA